MHLHLYDVQPHKHTHTQRRTRLSLWRWDGEAPPKIPAAPLAVPSVPWANREKQLFCCNPVGLPTTAISKEREGKPGYGPQLKIDPKYENQAPHLSVVYKHLVYAKSQCLPKGYL